MNIHISRIEGEPWAEVVFSEADFLRDASSVYLPVPQLPPPPPLLYLIYAVCTQSLPLLPSLLRGEQFARCFLTNSTIPWPCRSIQKI